MCCLNLGLTWCFPAPQRHEPPQTACLPACLSVPAFHLDICSSHSAWPRSNINTDSTLQTSQINFSIKQHMNILKLATDVLVFGLKSACNLVRGFSVLITDRCYAIDLPVCAWLLESVMLLKVLKLHFQFNTTCWPVVHAWNRMKKCESSTEKWENVKKRHEFMIWRASRQKKKEKSHSADSKLKEEGDYSEMAHCRD